MSVLCLKQSDQKQTIFGALEIFTDEVFYRHFPRQRTAEMIAFLEALCEHYAERPILLILDHAAIHKSRALMNWLAAHPQLELAYLPKFGGHKDNPVEKLWWHLKGSAAANRCRSLNGRTDHYRHSLPGLADA